MHSPRNFSAAILLFAALSLLPLLLGIGAAQASETGVMRQYNDEPSIEVHNRDTYAVMRLKELSAKTVIEGPLARTRISYLAENTHGERIEATVSLHLPEDTVLTGFGYYYGKRFIPGAMYDKDEAWKIYRAVTSRGRDPGIMDRPTRQDYHAQIFPVEPKQDLRIVVEMVQMLATDEDGAHFTLPIMQKTISGTRQSLREMAVSAEVRVVNHTLDDIADNFSDFSEKENADAGAVIRFSREWQPDRNWHILLRRETEDVAKSVFSRFSPGGREGFYALSITAPRAMERPRIVLRSRPGTSLSLPTRFNAVEAWERIHVVGRYTRPQTLHVTVYDEAERRSRQRPIHLRVPLSGRRVNDEMDNPAAALWADRRIDALQNATRRDFRRDIIALSKRFMVVSNFTSLLAIPKEEMDYYRNVLARQQVNTNTQWTGGGGGDPYIEVKAPADARQVVAVFPTGEAKNLIWDDAKGVWNGRFDIPWGTPEGEYRVTIIVVQRDGTRSRFALIYQNLLSAPSASAVPDALNLRARPGEAVQVRIAGENVRRAVAVAPWGERVVLTQDGGTWQGRVTVPAAWARGESLITVVLLDGAHNRTEVRLDLSVE